MTRGIIEGEGPVEVSSALDDIPRTRRSSAVDAMGDEKRGGRRLSLGQGQELRREAAQHRAVERHVVRDPEPIERREQQQRVFERFAKRLGLFDEETRPLRRRPRFRRAIAFDAAKRRDERDLQLDVFPAPRRCAGQRVDLADRLAEMGDRFLEGGAAKGLIARVAPPFDREVVEAGLGEVMGDDLRLGRGALAVLAQDFSGAAVQRLAAALEQAVVGRVLDKRVLEAIGRPRVGALAMRRSAPASRSSADWRAKSSTSPTALSSA
jgi:hypothetical protein